MSEVDRLGKYSGFLSVAETGLGSVLHAYHVPLAGHFLSLNQGFLLSRYIDEEPLTSSWSPYKISLMAAAVKSLSPIGKRLTPMLGISVQGLLFSLGVFLFGANIAGASAGMFLLSLWAFVQPALTLFVIFGKDLINISEFYFQEAQTLFNFNIIYLGYFILGLVVVKILVALALVYLAFSVHKHAIEKKICKVSQIKLVKQAATGAIDSSPWGRTKLLLKDLTQPLFLFSLILSFIFFYLTNPLGIKLVWYMLRPIAIAGVLFYARRWWRISALPGSWS